MTKSPEFSLLRVLANTKDGIKSKINPELDERVRLLSETDSFDHGGLTNRQLIRNHQTGEIELNDRFEGPWPNHILAEYDRQKSEGVINPDDPISKIKIAVIDEETGERTGEYR